MVCMIQYFIKSLKIIAPSRKSGYYRPNIRNVDVRNHTVLQVHITRRGQLEWIQYIYIEFSDPPGMKEVRVPYLLCPVFVSGIYKNHEIRI